MDRRDFMQLGGMAAFAPAIPALSFAKDKPLPAMHDEKKVNFIYDGLDLSPAAYASILQGMTQTEGFQSDLYSLGGEVEKLEKKMAVLLGKEAAVYFPTGTLANHVAIREHCKGRKRAIVQAVSHIYNDCGDTVQNLSNINLVPLRDGEATFTVADVQEVLERTRSGRVASEVGCISIESPVRRLNNQVFSYEEIGKISVLARKEDIALHMDGARLFNICAHSGQAPEAYTRYFDTVYVSLYKNFNAACGAVLAGSQAFVENLYHVRRMFGGGMPASWPVMAVALGYADGFPEEYRKSLMLSKALFPRLTALGLEVKEIPNGLNIYELHVHKGEPDMIREKLRMADIHLRAPAQDFRGFYLKLNPSLHRKTEEELYRAFEEAVKNP